MEVKNNLITTIPFKGVQVRVEFTGGNSMKNIPAKFYTRDPFTQRALDSSDQLGRLYSVHQVIKEAGDEAAPATPAGKAAGTTANAGKKVTTTKKPSPTTVTPPAKEPEPAPANPDPAPEAPATPAGEAAGTTAEGTAEGAGAQDGEKLEFESLAAAIVYVATKYGEQVETDAAVRKVIAEKEGVKVVIHKGV